MTSGFRTTGAKKGQRGSVLVGFLLGFIVAALFAAAVFWLRRSTEARIDASRPTVVRQIQQLSRLETVIFALDKIVAGEKDNPYLPNFIAGDRLLLMAYGEVTAGVDLGRMQAADVIVSGRTVRITVPPAELFVTRIDNDRTRVYSRATGLFARVDPNLESDVRREAERQVRQAALDNGVLNMAAANARTTLTSFLRGLGFEQVEVR